VLASRRQKNAIEALEVALETAFNSQYAKDQSILEAEKSRDNAFVKLSKLERDIDHKRDKIADLQVQVAQSADTVKQKEEEVSRLTALVKKLQTEPDGKGAGKGAAIAVHTGHEPRAAQRRVNGDGGRAVAAAASASPSCSKSRSRSRSRSRSQGSHAHGSARNRDAGKQKRKVDESQRRRGREREPSSDDSCSDSDSVPVRRHRGNSSSRAGSPRRHGSSPGGNTLDGDMGSWNDRRARSQQSEGKGFDSALCIPFILGTCTAGNGCTLRHPVEDDIREAREALKRKVCRFGADCHRTDCIFRHDGRKAERDSCRATPCRYGSSCKRADCKFLHKWDKPWAASSSSATSAKLCRYGADCRRTDCSFSHS